MSVFGGKDADFWEPLRQRLIPPLHSILRQYGGYAEHPAWKREYACTIFTTAEDMEVVLDDEWGFTRNPVASLKHTDEDVYEVGSWKRNYEETVDGEIVDGGFFAKWQLHIRIFPHTCTESCSHPEDVDAIDLYVHWELNPFYDPIAHYVGDGWDPKEGKKRTMEFVTDKFYETEYFDKYE